MADYIDCTCGRGRYNADSYTSCYECYQERAEGMTSCLFCGRWHSDEFSTCYKCRKQHGRDEAGTSIRIYIGWRDQYRCRNCGDAGIINIDHIKPCRQGGGAALWNLQVLCTDCNRVKGATWAPGGSWSQIRRGLYAYYFTSGRHWIDDTQRTYAAKDYDADEPITRLELWDQWLTHGAMIVDPQALDIDTPTEPGSFTCPQCHEPAPAFYGPARVCKGCWTKNQPLREAI
jgi:hypothetical protein